MTDNYRFYAISQDLTNTLDIKLTIRPLYRCTLGLARKGPKIDNG
jgi:hypothetical protein